MPYPTPNERHTVSTLLHDSIEAMLAARCSRDLILDRLAVTWPNIPRATLRDRIERRP